MQEEEEEEQEQEQEETVVHNSIRESEPVDSDCLLSIFTYCQPDI